MAEDSPMTQGGKDSPEEKSPFTVPQISLPKGGGAIRGIGEKFTANAATGTGSLSVPIALSPGRGGFSPQLSLAYDSGSGNGPFGIGWNLGLPSITRKTDKGLPRYADSQESDVFILTASEDLVPVLKEVGRDHWVPDEFERDGYRVKRYRPRIEGLFSRIERWTRLADGDAHWRSISKDNILTLYGHTTNARIVDPYDPGRVFSWLICESYDDKGNAIHYEYVAENEAGVDLRRPNERHRLRFANRYLKRIHYGNRKPLLLDVDLPSFRKPRVPLPELEAADWMFQVVFDYGDVDYTQEGPDHDGSLWVRAKPESRLGSHWPVRKDPFSTYRSGFEIRTYRLCRRVLMFHHFPHELGNLDYLVRSTEFEYHEKPLGSFVSRVVQSGYRRHADSRYLKKSLPALELTYTSSPLEDHNFRAFQVNEVDPENLPGGIDQANYRWLDLNGEGISGVLTEQGDAWFYKPNAGRGRFRPIEVVSPRPSLAALGERKQQLLDLAGDGRLDLVEISSPMPGFYERTQEDGWGSFRAFRSFPVLDWADPNLRFVDVTGDGIADVFITEDDAFTWHPSLDEHGFNVPIPDTPVGGGPGWGTAVRVPVPLDESEGPRVVFADGTQSIYLADMSGDGLSDIVRIRNGEVCYWPNTGYGTFGRKVTMDNSPWFEDPDLFDQNRIKLADTDGSGSADIVYLGRDGINVFLNQSGNGWSAARELPQFAAPADQTSVSVVDFLGRGTMCLLWSSALPSDTGWPLRYVDLMNGQKPHLLTHICNNLGAETRIEYASSTEFYLAGQAAGAPWITRLPFPVHVVKRVETFDYISRNRFVSAYSYHHGFFDGVEREFRGFGRVDQLDTEDFATLTRSGVFPAGNNIRSEFNVPPVLTRTWFHTGVFLGSGRVSRHLEHEYWREPGLSRSEQQAMLLDDTILPGDLTPEEAREACRALKGSTLRQETYALDRKEESGRPYTVTEGNLTIKLLQPRGRNRHAVFFTHARESMSCNYERKLYQVEGCRRADPRVTHDVNLEVDDFGNVLQSVNAAYGRRFQDRSPLLTGADHHKQETILLTFASNRYTNPVSQPDAYRVPLLAETRFDELIHVTPSGSKSGVTNLFRFHELAANVALASDGRHDLPYQDVHAGGAVTLAPYRRLLKQGRMRYRSNTLDRILPLGTLEALALPGESYKLAFTPGLLQQVYRRPRPDQSLENLLPDIPRVLHHQGGYVDLDQDGHWWVPQGRVFYSPELSDDPVQELAHAKNHFFQANRFRDPFGNVSTNFYDLHDLAAVKTRDAVGNTVHAVLDYRVVSPYLLTDANQNRSQVAFDALAMVVGTAVMGKQGGNEGDTLEEFIADLPERVILDHVRQPLHDPGRILQGATKRLVYDLFAFARSRKHERLEPPMVYTLERETHVADLAPAEKTRIRHGFSYSDGFGREIQKKTQAEAGPLTHAGPKVDPRWVGSGWTVFNNKGKPVRQYEPFFSATQEFEFAKIVGVSPIFFYDPLNRVVATVHPDHTLEKVIFDPWSQEKWDVNDTVLIANPEDDADIGGFLRKLPPADYLPTWYEQRRHGEMGHKEEIAAKKTAAHANTPALAYFDPLGRAFLKIAQNRVLREETFLKEHLETRTDLDIEGNQLGIADALHRPIMTYDYNMIKARIHQNSADAGQRWTLNDVQGKLLRTWDSRRHELRYHYDALRRPSALFVKNGPDHERLVERVVYGEDEPNALALNLRTRIFQQFDGAGLVINRRYDFKGNLLSNARQLLVGYRDPEVNWSDSPPLESPLYVANNIYDALNRIVSSTTPDQSTVQLHYNEASLLNRIDVNLRGAGSTTPFVSEISYDAKRQREFIAFGNGAHTHYHYDPLTFRLVNLKTTRAGRHGILQDLTYTYDPVGNITFIQDAAQEDILFKNQVVTPSNDYTYDAVYRLIAAEGREHIGQLAAPLTTWDDLARTRLPLPGDGQAMRRYNEHYHYDGAGNILAVIHAAAGGNWTRHYEYGETANNRLTGALIGNLHERYKYDPDGNMMEMPHLPLMESDFKDRLHSTQRQVVEEAAGQRTYYAYNSSGQRVRKVTARPDGSKAHERIYLNGFETYREYSTDGQVRLARESLHIMDGKRRIALAETRTADKKATPNSLPSTLIRYQFSNHLDSSTLELDESAAIISFEEYYPYGSTSYASVRKQVEVSPKRYRYTGKERDEETGLNYHGARYYAPWLGRWTSCDPAGLIDGNNLFLFCLDNPLKIVDANGMQGQISQAGAPVGSPLIDAPELGMDITVSRPKKPVIGKINDVEEPSQSGQINPNPPGQSDPVVTGQTDGHPQEQQTEAGPEALARNVGRRPEEQQQVLASNTQAASESAKSKQLVASQGFAAGSGNLVSGAAASDDAQTGDSGTSASSPATSMRKPKAGGAQGEQSFFSKVGNFLSRTFDAVKRWWDEPSDRPAKGANEGYAVSVGLLAGLAYISIARFSRWAKGIFQWGIIGAFTGLGLYGLATLKQGNHDKGLVDFPWSIVHHLAGWVMSIFGAPFLLVAAMTIVWEFIEWLAPDRDTGGRETGKNRVTDVGFAWIGWGLSRLLLH